MTMKENRWIPVTERLPESTGYYLITYTREICENEMAVAFFSREDYECNDPKPWTCSTSGDLKKIIAWMPMPDPYQK